MRLLALAVATALTAGAVSAPAKADPRPRPTTVQPVQGTTVYSRDENGRVRTKIIVQKRSYLDGGTEVMPGEVQGQYTNFVLENQRPTRAISNDGLVPTHPIPDPFYLPGKDNPYFR